MISEQLVDMPTKRKRKPNDDLVFKIMLSSALNEDSKAIAKKVKYSENIVREIIDSTPQLRLGEILHTYDGDCKTTAEKTNYSEKQVRKVIFTTQPTVSLEVLKVDSSTLSSTTSEPIQDNIEMVNEMKFVMKFVCCFLQLLCFVLFLNGRKCRLSREWIQSMSAEDRMNRTQIMILMAEVCIVCIF